MRDCHKCINEEHCFYPYDVDSCPNYLERVTAPKIEKPNLEKWKLPEFDIEGYQSPIEVIYEKIAADLDAQFENNVMTAIQRYAINVDCDELIKALNYDRRQYEAGYRTAMLRYKVPRGEWIRTALYGQTCYECNNCHLHYDITNNFCPNCGADMREEVES